MSPSISVYNRQYNSVTQSQTTALVLLQFLRNYVSASLATLQTLVALAQLTHATTDDRTHKSHPQ
jgi:hypothetical protein